MTPLLISQCAVIAGASRGIGLSIARLFTAEGASCLLVARSEPALKTAVRELEALRPVTTPPPEGRAAVEKIVVEMDQNQQQRFDYVSGDVGEESTWREVLRKEVCLVDLSTQRGAKQYQRCLYSYNLQTDSHIPQSSSMLQASLTLHYCSTQTLPS